MMHNIADILQMDKIKPIVVTAGHVKDQHYRWESEITILCVY